MMGRVACRLARRFEAERAARGDAGVLTAGSREFEHAFLHLLDAAGGPAGSNTLLAGLGDFGFRVSEPTVGRFLRALDRRGLTDRVPNRGRGLTDDGRARLGELCDAEWRSHYERELLRSIRSATIDDLVDVLIARRALERETARLAAERATDADVALLERAIEGQRAALDTGPGAAEADVCFHGLIAQTSRNRVLAAAIELIRRDQQITLTLDAMLRRTTHEYAVGHEGIVAAIRRHDPEAAERAMLGHIDTVIADMVVSATGAGAPTRGGVRPAPGGTVRTPPRGAGGLGGRQAETPGPAHSGALPDRPRRRL